jgi:hypothetical protein
VIRLGSTRVFWERKRKTSGPGKAAVSRTPTASSAASREAICWCVGLGQIRISAQVVSPLEVGISKGRGQHHDQKLSQVGFFADLFEHRQTVHIREIQIEQRQPGQRVPLPVAVLALAAEIAQSFPAIRARHALARMLVLTNARFIKKTSFSSSSTRRIVGFITLESSRGDGFSGLMDC